MVMVFHHLYCLLITASQLRPLMVHHQIYHFTSFHRSQSGSYHPSLVKIVFLPPCHIWISKAKTLSGLEVARPIQILEYCISRLRRHSFRPQTTLVLLSKYQSIIRFRESHTPLLSRLRELLTLSPRILEVAPSLCIGGISVVHGIIAWARPSVGDVK